MALGMRPRLQGGADGERGVALVLVLLIVALLYIIVAELVTRSNFDQMTAHNQSVESNVRLSLALGLGKAVEQLAEDSNGGEGGAEGGLGALGGAGAPGAGGLGGVNQPDGAGGVGGALGGGEAGGEGEEEAVGDSSRDGWFKPTAIYDDNNIAVYAFFEDENRKFNLLSLVSPDKDFADLSRNRLVRLLDRLWEGTEKDIGHADAEIWVKDIQEWMSGRERNDDRPEPPLKTKVEGEDLILPLSLDELRLLPRIPHDVFDDRVIGEDLLRGLYSVLTVHSSLAVDQSGEEGSGTANTPAPAGQGGTGATGGAGTTGGTTAPTPGGGEQQGMIGTGVQINPNTAPRVVLECLEDESEVPLRVVEALVRFRNEVDEEAEEKAAAARGEQDDGELLAEDSEKKLKYFKAVGDLNQVEDWDNLPENDGKKRFESMLTTESNVFTIWLAVVHKRNDAGTAYSVTRARTTVVRVQDAEGWAVQTIVPLHKSDVFRLFLPDFPEEEEEARRMAEQDMEDFALEERAWNPFFPEFYDPEQRERYRR